MSVQSDHDKYLKCVKKTHSELGLTIECKLGLWSVEGRNPLKVEAEAQHYWIQYNDDGEYSSIIGGPTVAEVLLETQGRK